MEGFCKFVSDEGERCSRATYCKGWCGPHYEQQRRGFPLRPLLESIPIECRVEGCNRVSFARRKRLCHTHYGQWRRGALGGYPERLCINCDQPFTSNRSDTLTCGGKCSMETSRLKHNYGITGSELNAMLAAQDHKCFTCRRPIERGAEDRALLLHIDHDHACCPGQRSCGKCLRKILCFSCNNALGLMDDRVEVAQALADYLADFHAQRIERLGEVEALLA